MKSTRDIRDMIERAGRYQTNGSAAVKVQEQPKVHEPSKKHAQKTSQVKKTGLKGVLQELPTKVKAELIITLAVVAAVIMGLLVMQISVASLTAKNNAMLSEINELEAKTMSLTEQIDSEIDLDEVNAVIEAEGMVHPQSGTPVNP